MAQDRYTNNSTAYEHPQESNLLNIHKVMQYNATGQPVARVHVDGITLEGNVIVDTVSLSTSTLAALETINVIQSSTPWIISGTVISSNFTSTVNIASMPAISGTVVVSNFTSTINVASIPAITGTVTVSNFTSTVYVSNTLTISNTSFAITNFPTTSTVYQGTDPWTITGTVSIGSIGEIEIKNDTGNPIPVSANTSSNSNTNPIYVKGTSDTSFFAPVQSDAFGRLRVSEPFTLNDTFNRYQDNGASSTSTVGSGSVGYNPNSAAVTLTVGTGATDAVYRESNRVYAYQPGKSLLILQTFTFNQQKTNLTQRAGYFDVANGYYVEQVGTQTNFVERTSVSGVMTETRKPQSEWNTNTVPGLDMSKSQILWTDIEWLGVGTVRMGFVIDGQFIICHQWHHANLTTGTYITTSCLPIRKEIFNTGITTSTSTMLSICNSVISEGGYNITGRPFCVGHNLTAPVALSNTATAMTPVISIRLKNNRLGAIVLPTTFTISPVQQAMFKYEILTRAITTGGTWISAGSNSSVEYNLNPGVVVTTGTVALSSFINATNQSAASSVNSQLPFDYQLERNSFNSTCYEVVITVGTLGNNATCYGAINWTEIT